jgi:hypothetical protein
VADVVNLNSWRVPRIAAAAPSRAEPLAGVIDDLRAIIEAAGELDLTAKAKIANAVAAALGGDAKVPGYWQICYRC